MNAPAQLTQVARAAEAATQSELDRLLQRPFTPRDLLEDNNFDKIWRMAEALANSALSIPKELKGNIGDCMAIVTQAMIWGLNPFAVAQKAHVINGKLGYEAQLVNAVVMSSGAIRGSFSYEYRGTSQDLECRVGAVLNGEQEITWGEFYGVRDVKVKNSPLWATNPKQQLGYLQVKNWARAYAPGALLGVYSADELDELPAPEEALTRGPQRRSKTAAPAEAAVPTVGSPEAAPKQEEPTAPMPAVKLPPAPSAAGDARGAISVGQVAYLRNKIKAAGKAESEYCAQYEVGSIEEFNVDMFDVVKSELLALT